MKEDLTGKKYNRWTVLGFSHTDKYRTQFWNCICECGKQKIINAGHLRTGRSKSCGCLQRAVGCKKDLISSRIKLGWDTEKAIFTPAGVKQGAK